MPYEVDLHSNKWVNKLLLLLMMVMFVSSPSIIMFYYFQNDFYSIFPLYTIAFASYFMLIYKNNVSIFTLFGLGVFVRLLILFCFPNLSDDIYRFYWDGKLIHAGINPYGILPSQAILLEVEGLTKDVFDNLNSPNYYTIYPPVNQLYFALSAWSNDIYQASFFMKLLVLITELVGLFYIIKLLEIAHLDKRLSMVYFINPLVILEGVGNLHFEVVMLSFLAGALYYLFTNRFVIGCLLFALSIGVKLLPIMLLPYFWFRLNGSRRWVFFSTLLGFCVFIFLPMASGIALSTFFESIDLYFRKFEFNASIYYILRWLGYQFSGYNLIKYIGPLLALIVVLMNLYIARNKSIFSSTDFIRYALIAWTLYLLFSTTVHPWYLISILFFSIFLKTRFPILWTYLVFITYVNYSNTQYYENYWFVSLEYLILGVILYKERNQLILPYLGKG